MTMDRIKCSPGESAAENAEKKHRKQVNKNVKSDKICGTQACDHYHVFADHCIFWYPVPVRTKVELTPEMEFPMLLSALFYAGASPDDIKDLSQPNKKMRFRHWMMLKTFIPSHR